MKKPGINLIDAALLLCGVESIDARPTSAGIGRELYQALEALELAIAMGELKSTVAQTTLSRKLEGMIQSAAAATGSEVLTNPGSSTYVVPSDLQSWWRSKTESSAVAVESVESDDRPLSTRERNTLLVTLWVVTQIANLPIDRPSKVAEIISSEAQKRGVSLPARSVADKLKLLPHALAARGK
jgi:hypothetical protein